MFAINWSILHYSTGLLNTSPQNFGTHVLFCHIKCLGRKKCFYKTQIVMKTKVCWSNEFQISLPYCSNTDNHIVLKYIGKSPQVVSRLTIFFFQCTILPYTSGDEKPTKGTEYQAAWITFHPVTHPIQGLQLPKLSGINDNENKQRLFYGQVGKNYECKANSRVPFKSITEKCSVLNPLMPQVSAQCTLQKTNNLNGHPLLHTRSDDEFKWCSFLSALHCATTRVTFWQWRVNSASCHDGTWINVGKRAIYSSSRHQPVLNCQLQDLDALNLVGQPLVSTQ